MDKPPVSRPEKRIASPDERAVYQGFRDSIESGVCSVQELRIAYKSGLLSLDQFAKLAAALAERLEKEVVTSNMTEILNNKLLESELEGAIQKLNSEENQAQPEKKRVQTVMVIFLDIDGMKRLNDEYDHSVGNKAIIAVADRLKASIKKQRDRIFHIHGDEFVAVLQISEDNSTTLEKIFERIEETLNKDLSVDYNDDKIPFKVSMGYKVLNKGDKVTAAELINMADTEMAKNKSKSRNTRSMYDRTSV